MVFKTIFTGHAIIGDQWKDAELGAECMALRDKEGLASG